jgi:hypothetical protein
VEINEKLHGNYMLIDTHIAALGKLMKKNI